MSLLSFDTRCPEAARPRRGSAPGGRRFLARRAPARGLMRGLTVGLTVGLTLGLAATGCGPGAVPDEPGSTSASSTGTGGGTGGEGGSGTTSSSVSGSGAGGAGGAAPGPPGTLRWKHEHGLHVHHGPARGADGKLFLQGKRAAPTPEGAPTLIALSPEGALLWGANTEPATLPAPPLAIDGERLIAPASATETEAVKGRVYRFTLEGTALEPLSLDGPAVDALAVAAPTRIVVPAISVFAFEGEAPAWKSPYSFGGKGKSGTNVAIGPSGTAYVGSRGDGNHLVALAEDGTLRWKVTTGAAFADPIAIGEGERVHAVDADGRLSVWDADGALVWSFQAPARAGGLAIGEGGVVYFGTQPPLPSSDEALVFAVREGEAGSGEIVWTASLPSAVAVTPALSAGGTLYVGDACKTLYALDAATGDLRWSFSPPGLDEDECAGGWSSAALGGDGVVYASVGGDTFPGTLYALEGDGKGLSPDAPWPGEQRDGRHGGRLPP